MNKKQTGFLQYRWFRGLMALLALLSGLGISELLVHELTQALSEETREDAVIVGDHIRHNLESHLKNYQIITSGVRNAIQLSGGKLKNEQIESLLALAYQDSEFLHSISVAPQDRLSYVFPLQDNEAELGLHYPDSPRQWPAVKRAQEDDMPVLTGPISLEKGGQGLFYYTPVFLADGSYWGVVRAVIDADRFFSDVIQGEKSKEHGVALRYDMEKTGTRDALWGDAFAFSGQPVLLSIEAPGAFWQLAITPAQPDLETLNDARIEGGVVSILLALLILALLNTRARDELSFHRLVSISSQIPGVAFQYQLQPDGAGSFSYLSFGIRELYEVEPEAAVRTADRIFDHLIPEDRQKLEADMAESARNLSPWHAIYRVRLPERELRWHQFDAKPVRQGDMIYWHGHIADITRRKQVEIEYATIIDTTHDGFVVCNANGRFLEVNDAYCELTGYSREQLLGMSISDMEASATPDGVRNQIAHVLYTGYAHFETQQRRSDGSLLDLDISVSAMNFNGERLVMFMRDIRERKRQEARLRDSENRFRSMANNAPVLIWLADADKHCFWFNQVWLDFTGRSLEDDTGIRWIMAGVHPDDQVRCNEIYSECFNRREPFVMDYRFKRHDGAYRWIRNNGIPRFDTDGVTFMGYIGSCIDVTDYRSAVEKVRESEERLKFAFDGTGDGMWDWNVVTGKTFLSQRLKEMLGYGDDEIGDTVEQWQSLIHPDDLARVLEKIRLHFISSTLTYSSEHRVLCRDGQYRWVLDRGVLVGRDEWGEPLRMLGTYTDITATKNAEAELAASESRFRALFEYTPVAYQSLDRDGCVLDVNQPLCELLGYSRDALIGQHFRDFLHASSAWYVNFADSFEQFINTGVTSNELTLVNQQGQPVSIMLNGRVQRDMDGAFLRTHCVLADISVQKSVEQEILKAKEAAERLAETRTLFLANMSHEIRTPMNAILGFLQLLQQTELSIRQLDYVGKARIAAESLLNILNDILNFTKIESGKLELELTPFRLDDGLRNLSLILASSSRNKDLDILFDISPTLPETLVGDPLRLHQVLLNLSTNAVKFTERGEVAISLKDILTIDEQVVVEFSVTDTGIGISEEKLMDIFEGFAQAESSTTRHYGGTGLGLAISQRLVQLMGGELTVTSQLGKGSCFTFTLAFPYIRQPKIGDMFSASDDDEKMHVLVVDDNPHGVSSFQKLAQRIGWKVDAVASGQAALDLLAMPLPNGQSYRAVFIDRKMSPMDGLSTIRGLRRICESRPVPLILMDNRQTYETLLADVIPESDRPDAFLIKPSTGSMLFDAYTEASSEGLFMDSRIEIRSRGEQLAGLKLLLVEDNPFNQQVASELLTRNGAEVDIANNGLEGVERALAVARPYDAILMDVQMPVMDGYEATRQIRAKGRKDQVIIAMTANAFQSDRDACLAVGMNAYISKPFTVDTMLKVITEARSSVLKQTNDAAGRDSDLVAVLAEETPTPSLPEESQAESHTVVFDVDSALTLLDEDRALLTELVEAFWENYPEQRAALGAAIEMGDSPQARNLAHALKGNAGYFFAQEFKSCAYQLEILCKDQKLDEARTHLPQLDAAIERFMAACKTEGFR